MMAAEAAFGARLRELRTAAGVSQSALARAAGTHQTTVSGIENGHAGVSYSLAARLLEALPVAPRERRALLAEIAQADGARSHSRTQITNRRTVADIEADTRRHRVYGGPLLPEVLRTPAYERQVLTLAGIEDLAEEILEILAQRQERLFGAGHRLDVLIAAGAAEAVPLTADERRHQHERLEAAAALPGVHLRTLPTDRRGAAPAPHGFCVHTGGHRPGTVVVETTAGLLRQQGHGVVAAHERLFARAAAAACRRGRLVAASGQQKRIPVAPTRPA